VSFEAGKITALLGQNGSGKSTLIKVLAGFYAPDPGGVLSIHGEQVDLPLDPRESHARGLRFLHQDLALVDALSIADNFAFADRFRTRGPLGPINRSVEHARVARALERFGIDEHPGRPVGQLDATARTMVAIARAFQDETGDRAGGNILILDEPTASLPAEEVQRVLALLGRVRDQGGTVIYVSHRLHEVMQIADRMAVLRDGKLVADREMAGLDVDAVMNLILGGNLVDVAGERAQRNGGPAEDVLSVRGLSGHRLRDVDFEVRRGEILGVAGLVGCGRSELARLVSGAERPRGGELRLGGEPYHPHDPAAALDRGVSYVPQGRRTHGCVPAMSLRDNLTLGRLSAFTRRGRLDLGAERDAAAQMIRTYRIQPPRQESLVAYLSGGNQQKAVIARAVRSDLRLLVLDEPLQGVDAGAKHELSAIIRGLAEHGVATLLGSTDAEDLVGLCDRVLVLDRGRAVACVSGSDLTEERLMVLSNGSLEERKNLA
jgi:ribose transport system ATP-binding protein